MRRGSWIREANPPPNGPLIQRLWVQVPQGIFLLLEKVNGDSRLDHNMGTYQTTRTLASSCWQGSPVPKNSFATHHARKPHRGMHIGMHAFVRGITTFRNVKDPPFRYRSRSNCHVCDLSAHLL